MKTRIKERINLTAIKPELNKLSLLWLKLRKDFDGEINSLSGHNNCIEITFNLESTPENYANVQNYLSTQILR
ncbi:hypothetical protein [Massilibacteroides sp.]|uniref:hypothetical protein n=1 Tax=Massilibacteroides sp. TaxID=2034766 RepID=UPI002633279D|nr:hypothetical protein [Massilibacteroides sp.]MDD4515684.1 hypothetical protein [Massilibacteroides sp.]